MWRRVSIKTPPALLPMAAADLAARLRIDDAGEHGLLDDLLREACACIDGPDGIGVALMRQTWTLTLEGFYPLIDLPGWPIVGISEIRYLDETDTPQIVDPALYRLVAGVEPAIVTPRRGAAWPRCPVQPGAVEIDYLLGAETIDAAEPGLVTAAALIAGHYYEHRATVVEGAAPVEIPLGASQILARYRRGLAGA